MSPFTGGGLSPTAGHHRELLRQMMRIRRFDKVFGRLLKAAENHTRRPLQSGAEAIAAGTLGCLAPTDAVVTAYQPHDYALARGLSMESVLRNLLGTPENSPPLYDAERRFYGIGPTGSNALSIATGAALGDRLRGTASITACFLPADSIDPDELHECMIRSAQWQLPLLLCCPSAALTPSPLFDLSSYAIPVRTVDGGDVLEVEAATRLATEIVRRGGPCLLELRTRRLTPKHGRYDAVEALTRRMRAGGELSRSALRNLRRAVRDEVRRALTIAKSSPAT